MPLISIDLVLAGWGSVLHSAFYLLGLLRNSIITSYAVVLRNLNRYQPGQLCDLCAS